MPLVLLHCAFSGDAQSLSEVPLAYYCESEQCECEYEQQRFVLQICSLRRRPPLRSDSFLDRACNARYPPCQDILNMEKSIVSIVS
jgi:hypothetical protein